MKSKVLLLIFSFSIAFLAMSDFAMAQIDSRNQTRSDREQNLTDPDKKKKKDRKKKDKNRRLKAKRDARSSARKDRRSSKKKIYSNRKQIRENSRKYRKAREVDRSYQGDITGRKIDRPKNRKREQKRTYEQTDPYQNRRIRTERSRAGPDAPAVRTATKRGERARSGDISGQRIVRQKSRKSAPRTSYPQTNPYIGRKIRTEKERAKSNDRQIESVRSITRSSESKGATYKQRDPYKGRKPKTERQRSKSNYKQIRSVRSATRSSESRKARAGRVPVSATAAPRLKQKRNVYSSHTRVGGEKSTTKDIAGKKLRTRNTRSAIGAAPIKYSSINPYTKRKTYKEGQRFRRTATRYSSARSISRSSESAANRSYDSRYGQHRNRRSVRTSGVASPKRIRSTANLKRQGDRRIYGNKYAGGQARSVSGRTQGGPKKPRAAVSISGRRKRYNQKNTYRGKDRHFGEYSTTKDIAGRKLRTRNKRSFHPTWAEFGGGSYGTGSVSGKPTKKYSTANGRRKSRANWNNGGMPIIGKSRGINSQTTSKYTGRMPLSSLPAYGPGKGSQYRGNINIDQVLMFKGGNESRYSGNRKARKRIQGGGSITAFWNNKGIPIAGRGPVPRGESVYTGRMPLSALPGYGPTKSSTYQGNINASKLMQYKGGNESVYTGNRKAKKRLQGGGSITAFWNNKGAPIAGRGPGPKGESSFTGRLPLNALPAYGPGKEGVFQGKQKGYKPLKGGGSISGMWNNSGKPIRKRDRSPLDVASSGYRGSMPLSALPGYGSGREGSYAGNIKSRKPLKGGGSISGHWNNRGQPIEGKGPGKFDVGRFTGNLPLNALPSYSDGKEGSYQGNMRAKKPLKGGGSITGLWNNKGQPIQGRGPGKYDVGRFSGNLPLSALPAYSDGKEGSYQGNMRAKKPLKGGGSITGRWNNKGQPIEGKEPGKYDVGRFSGNLPLSALPGYSDGKEGTYQGSMKRKDVKIAQSPGTERGRTKSLTFLRVGDPNHMGLNHHEEHLKVKNDLPNELSRLERQRIEDADGMSRGRTQSLSFMRLGNPNQGGLRAELGNKKRKNDLPAEIKGKQRLRIVDAEGMDRGRSKSLSFLKLGNPGQGGLHAEYGNKKRKTDLPSELSGKQKIRLTDAQGMDNGKNVTFSFWTIGDPSHGGLVRSPAQAKGRLHPSADYTRSGKNLNSIEKKDQPVKIKIWFAKLFKKNANQPDAVKKKDRRPRYDKTERDIWETAEREDWYKN